MSISCLGYVQQHLGHVWLVPEYVLEVWQDPSTACPVVPGHWGRLWTFAFMGAWRKRCVQGSVCMSTDGSTAGSLWTARGCFTGRVTEPWNWLPGEAVESSSHTNITKCFPWSCKQSSDWRDWEGLSFTDKGFSTIKSHPKNPHIPYQ